MPGKLLTVQELADLVGVPAQTVYVWRTRGGGPAGIRIGRHLRFDAVDVEAWLESHKSDRAE